MAPRPALMTTGTALVAIVLAASACTSSGAGTNGTNAGSNTPPSPASMSSMSGSMHPGTGGSDATATVAASLRAGLDELLREHVDLTGFAVQTAVINGLGSPDTSQALKALDDNTVALGKAIGSVYGKAAEKAFDTMWRAHIGFFVEYTKGLATHDQALAAKANKELAGYRRDFSKFLHSATGLPTSAVSADLQGHVETLEAAIKAIVTKSPSAAAKLQMAAEHMDGTAQVLAAGIAKQQKLAGNADGAASALRGALTGLLIQHVAQTGAVVQTAVETGLTSPQTKGAVGALDHNTLDLGKAIGSLYGKAAQKQFITMWRAHIGFFVDYTKGLATNDQALVKKANTQLAGYKQQFSKFLGSATGLPASAIAADLQGHVETLEDAIKAIVTKSPDAGAKIATAESHMAGTAAVLAKAIAAQKHLS